MSLTFTGEVFLNSGTAFKASRWNCCVEGRKLTTNNPFFNPFLFSLSIFVSNDWNKDTTKYKTVFLLNFDYGNIKTTNRFKPWKVLLIQNPLETFNRVQTFLYKMRINSWIYLNPTQLQVEFISLVVTDDLVCTILEHYNSYLFKNNFFTVEMLHTVILGPISAPIPNSNFLEIFPKLSSKFPNPKFTKYFWVI